MRMPRIVEAMNGIDDELVSWAAEYQRTPGSFFRQYRGVLKACACILALAIVMGAVLLGQEDSDEASSPFTLTAYAMSQDGIAATAVLQMGKTVPVSTFQTAGGITGFVISYNKMDEDTLSTIAVLSKGTQENIIDEIAGLEMDTTQNYYICVPAEDEEEPYTFPLILTDKVSNMVYQYEIRITQTDGVYYAELTEEKVMERVTK